uniref:Uncharacterized protein n=1 Tax=viral metagenome TaxID=1070528 RepID=A0A6M3L2C6_9ZZZZ
MKIYDKKLRLYLNDECATFRLSEKQRDWLESQAAEQDTTVSGIAKDLLSESAAANGYTGNDYAGFIAELAVQKHAQRSEVVRGIIDAAMIDPADAVRDAMGVLWRMCRDENVTIIELAGELAELLVEIRAEKTE